MQLLAIKLLVAHVIGDFLLQPNAWVQQKEQGKMNWGNWAKHLLIHAVLTWAVVGFQLQYGWAILAIVSTHGLIDYCKVLLHAKMQQVYLFVADQLLHLIVIVRVAYSYQPGQTLYPFWKEPIYWAWFLAILLNTKVAAICIKILLHNWKLKEESPNKAGMYIGILERMFVLGFVMLQFWEGIGFLLAAKSVFRFGDLNKNSDRNLTEYVLIGTLLSFGMAILIALVLQMVIQ